MSLLLVLALLTVRASGCDGLCSREAFDGYWHLLAMSAFNGTYERAAFVVKDPAGRLRMIGWRSNEKLYASYRGIVPANAIAIAHTHPYQERDPSAHDVAESRRVGMPIIVVTIDSVMVAMPDGRIRVLARGTDWRSKARE